MSDHDMWKYWEQSHQTHGGVDLDTYRSLWAEHRGPPSAEVLDQYFWPLNNLSKRRDNATRLGLTDYVRFLDTAKSCRIKLICRQPPPQLIKELKESEHLSRAGWHNMLNLLVQKHQIQVQPGILLPGSHPLIQELFADPGPGKWPRIQARIQAHNPSQSMTIWKLHDMVQAHLEDRGWL